MYALLDAAKCADALLLVLDCDAGVDERGDACLSCLTAQGMPTAYLTCQVTGFLSPRQGELCFHLGCWINNVCPCVCACVCVCVCPTLIGGVLYAALLPLCVGRLTRDLGHLTANTSQMCLLGVT